jgi:hypothetical protein
MMTDPREKLVKPRLAEPVGHLGTTLTRLNLSKADTIGDSLF